MTRISGIAAFLQMLADTGVNTIFGNPGTTELPLNDALVDDDRFRYVLGLQEVPVMAMADGYAMASGKLGVVNLHISCGLGNAMGMLYNAFREGTPLLVTAGQTDRRLAVEEPILWSDMVAVARPWTKWAVQVERVEDFPAILRRAMQTALTPPTGPVFLSMPLDVQTAIAELDVTPTTPLNTRVRPPSESLQQAAQLLASSRNPAFLVGSRLVERDAVDAAVRVAEILGTPVISESGTTHGRLAFPSNHPLYALGLPLWSPEVRERLAEFDCILVAGMDLLRQYVYHEPARAIPEYVRVVHLDEDPWQLGKNYPLAVGVLGDVRSSLEELSSLLETTMTADQRRIAQERGDRRAQEHREARKQFEASIAKERDLRPMTPLTLMQSLSRVLPPDVAVIEEAVTTTNTTFERLGALKNTTGYFGHRGWALGWGLGCSLGVKLAWPNRPVLAMLGEGSAMYGIQGLWSAARYKLGVTFVICNNAQYQILKIGARQLELPRAREGRYLGLDITEPEIDFVALARSLGVEAHRVTEPDELAERVAASLAGDKPQLFDVPIGRGVPKRLNYG
jgi:benzoylformate decarboxylase